MSLRFAIGFELDNAEAIDDIELILASYESVLASASLFLGQEPKSKCLVALVHSDQLSPALVAELTGVQSDYTHLDYTVVANTSGSYFGAKNASAGLAEKADVVAFATRTAFTKLTFYPRFWVDFKTLK